MYRRSAQVGNGQNIGPPVDRQAKIGENASFSSVADGGRIRIGSCIEEILWLANEFGVYGG